MNLKVLLPFQIFAGTSGVIRIVAESESSTPAGDAVIETAAAIPAVVGARFETLSDEERGSITELALESLAHESDAKGNASPGSPGKAPSIPSPNNK